MKWVLSGIQGKQLSKLFFLPSEKGCTLKGKNLLPEGANSFFSEQTWEQSLSF